MCFFLNEMSDSDIEKECQNYRDKELNKYLDSFNDEEPEGIPVWLLYDGRYRTDKDSAICFEVRYSLEEALNNCNDYGKDTVIVEGTELNDEIIENRIIN